MNAEDVGTRPDPATPENGAGDPLRSPCDVMTVEFRGDGTVSAFLTRYGTPDGFVRTVSPDVARRLVDLACHVIVEEDPSPVEWEPGPYDPPRIDRG